MIAPLLAALAFILLATPTIAQQPGEAAPGYILSRQPAWEPGALTAYGRAAVPIVGDYGGRFLALSSEMEVLEGVPDTRRLALIAFPSAQAAAAFWGSEAYREARALRSHVGDFDVVLVEGTAP